MNETYPAPTGTPVQPAPPPEFQQPVKRTNGMGVAALVIGLIGAAMGIIPLLAWFALIMGVLATVFGFVGLRKARRPEYEGKKMSLAGLILGMISLALGVIGFFILSSAVSNLDKAFEDLDTAISAPTFAPAPAIPAPGLAPSAPKQPQPGAETVAAQLSGNGGQTTRPFTVSEGWELRWDLDAGEYGMAHFSAYLKDASGRMVDVIANSSQPGPGSSYQARGGTYSLEINAVGSWTLKVVDLP